ncbi:MAG TPA: ATPase domain-containing protein [Noviherbaspirillum sp.]|jgi:circadian clock protein KaiC|uniref:ATPase domain-containing protein n=1 Tax=Noviherbaspirillum sp. TaxID=1926288 RepID=UPI002DDDB746|nr:ATPase domain-containing protein [Noviherbaspirillum sp.]HEV2612664.1 ATPase domain-containing protein [Noviherbaspirillum sp.]
MNDKVVLGKLPTGVPGLDTLLGGGLTEFSFNVIAGAPGSCKTTLAHQIMFSLVGQHRKALFFTVIGEPPLKMLRYQQQYSFFDIDKVGSMIRYVNLSDDLKNDGFSGVLSRILNEVADFQPSLIFVDSFKSVVHTAKSGNEGIADIQQFVQTLGIQLATWEATTFLIGEYPNAESEASPIFTVADGLISLSQSLHENYVVRKIRIVKMRGQAHLDGLHTFRINDDGLRVYPRVLQPSRSEQSTRMDVKAPRVTMGNTELDAMLCGGLPRGYSLLVAGPSGSGKTVLATTFLAEGAKNGEHGLIASLERSIAQAMTSPLAELVRSGQITVMENRSLGLSVEEVVDNLLHAIDMHQTKRLVIDSLSTLELVIAPEFRHNFLEAMYRMVANLTARGVTVLITTEPAAQYGETKFVSSDKAFLTDAVIALRFFESDGDLKRMIMVPKVRGCVHSTEIRQFTITDDGLVIGNTLRGYQNLFSGEATKKPPVVDEK